MRLKSSIFLWVSLATIIPLTALILGITAYSERIHRKDIDSEIKNSMANIASKIDFRIDYERKVIISLATSPAMKQFFPVLKLAAEGDLHANYFEEVEELNDFLAGFQHSVPGLDTVRVLDIDGHTLVKVRFGKHLPALFESMKDVPYAEEELVNERFLNWMLKLKPNKLVYGQLPLSQRDIQQGQELSMLNSIVPLADEKNNIIGFLTARAVGDQLDHIIKTLPRTHNLRINITELNPDNSLRHGMLLYSDDQRIVFNQLHEPGLKLHNFIDEKFWQQLQDKRFGTYFNSSDSQRYYYQEYYPYSNQLVSWMLILQLDRNALAAPFNSIRIGLFIFAAVALFISLLLANLGAIHIAEPIIKFSQALKNYADGNTKLNSDIIVGSEELEQLDQSFHYLVDTLETAQDERDHAQNMMLQKAKLASIGEMAAGIGHEINNPLNNILSYTKLIERDIPDKNNELKEDLEGLRSEALRAGRIVKGILNFARQVPPEYTKFNLKDWINDTLLLVESEAHTHHVKTQLSDLFDTTIEGDRQQLQQVLVNLLMNAIHASSEGSSISILCEKTLLDQIIITVSDQGKGISNNDIDKIFDPFFTTKMVGEGSGLGLSISLGIIQFHHGQLKLENNNSGGVDASIILPIDKPDNDK
jgi:two-component system, NtrC family, sensor kinase